MIAFVRNFLIVAAFVVVEVRPCSAAAPDANFYYKLSTVLRGPGLVLDVSPGNNMTRLEASQDLMGQFWRIAPVAVRR
jgi:hypothetical protein